HWIGWISRHRCCRRSRSGTLPPSGGCWVHQRCQTVEEQSSSLAADARVVAAALENREPRILREGRIVFRTAAAPELGGARRRHALPVFTQTAQSHVGIGST